MSTFSPTSPKKLDLSKVHDTDASQSKEKAEKRKSIKEKHRKNVEGARQTMDGALKTESGGRKHKSKTHKSKGDKASVDVSPRSSRHEKDKRRTVAVGDSVRGEGRSPRSGPPPGGVSIFSPSSPPNSPRDIPSSPRSNTKPQIPVIRRSETDVRDGTAPVSPRRTDFLTPRTPRGPANTASVIRSETSPTIPLHEQPGGQRSFMQVAQNVEVVRRMPELKEATPEMLEETLKQQQAHFDKVSAKRHRLANELKKIDQELTDTASTMEAIRQEQKARSKSAQASPGKGQSGSTIWGVETMDALEEALDSVRLPGQLEEKQ
jgi:hypothetical protein